MRYSYRNNVRENRVLPFVCNAHDCTHCVQIWIHGFNHIKTHFCEHNISSRRASNERPYGFVTFIKIIFNKNFLPLPASVQCTRLLLIVQTVSMLRSGIICFALYKLSTREKKTREKKHKRKKRLCNIMYTAVF